MPRLYALPHEQVIKSLKGTLDFYYWRGVPCVRKWPVIPMSSRTPASLESADIFGDIAQAWALVAGNVKAYFQEDSEDQPRTARDIYMTATYGHLHEHS